MKNDRHNKQGKFIIRLIPAILFILIVISVILLFRVLSIKKDLQSQFEQGLPETEAAEEQKEIQIYLPEIYYAGTGLTMEIYNAQVTSECNDITKYNVLWSCDIGENLERKYSLTATEEMIGEHELTLSVYDNALKLLAQKTCILKVVNGKAEEPVGVLQVGKMISDNDILYHRLQELTGNKIIFEKVMSVEEFSVDEVSTDAVQIFFEADHIQDGEANAAEILTLVEKLLASGVNVPVYVVNAVYEQEPDSEAVGLMKDLSEKLAVYENVYFVPVGISVDSEYNYTIKDVTCPKEAGYAQIADMMFSAFCGICKK